MKTDTYILDLMGGYDEDDNTEDYVMEHGYGRTITRQSSTGVYDEAGYEIGRTPITDLNYR